MGEVRYEQTGDVQKDRRGKYDEEDTAQVFMVGERGEREGVRQGRERLH